MEACLPSTANATEQWLQAVTTPLREAAWERALEKYPDKEFVRWLLQGIREGFRIGFDRNYSCTPFRRNLRSAQDNPSVVEEYLSKELELGRILGPFNQHMFSNKIRISPFGVIPKSQPGKWRLIVDLSSPEDKSVNDGIDKPMCSLKYITVDDIVENVIKCGGRGALLWKAGYTVSLPHCTCAPRRSTLAGDAMGGSIIYRCNTVVWFAVSPKKNYRN